MIANPSLTFSTNTPKQRSGFTLGELVIATAIVMVIAVVAFTLLLPVQRAREPARRSQCRNNLKQIALALFNYHDQYHAFPPAYTVDADGKPLHSWRTLILPYMDQKALYDKIDLTKPWDDPVNVEVFKSISFDPYRCPSEPGPASHTTYLAVVTSNSCLRHGESARISDIKDGLANTLMVTEVDSEHAVPWMAPRDADESLFLAISPTSKLVHTGGVQAVFADGTVRFLNADLTAEIRRTLITIDGKDYQTGFF
ncbi:MAG: DUF1559 domain-containing protein [Planctomycetaceae bacterium]